MSVLCYNVFRRPLQYCLAMRTLDGLFDNSQLATASRSKQLHVCIKRSHSSFGSYKLKLDSTTITSRTSPRKRDFDLSVCGDAEAHGSRNGAVCKASSVDIKTDGQAVSEEAVLGRIERLQNGSDIRGIAMEGEGREVNLTPSVAFFLGEAFGIWLADYLGVSSSLLRVSLGRDPRLTGPALLAATAAGLRSIGCAVFDMSLATTPACFMSTVLSGFSYDASIMLTASHLPATRNGFKFFTKDGGLKVEDIESICNIAAMRYIKRPDRGAAAAAIASSFSPSPATPVSFMPVYAAHLREIIKKGINHPTNFDQPLSGFKVVVNAGNGSGGFFAWDVLEKLGADVNGSVNLGADGAFPNHTPNPEDKEAMSVTSRAVREAKADLGVVFDTDVDRSGVVDSSGQRINGDRFIALLASIVLSDHPGSTIVTDARTSNGLTTFIENRGGKHCLFRVGYRNVIDRGVQLNQLGMETHLMIETTGHGAMKENYFLDDGAYLAVKVIIQMALMRLHGSFHGIGGLIQDLVAPKENTEIRIKILSRLENVKHRGGQVVEAFRRFLVDGSIPRWDLAKCGDCWVSDGCLADFGDGLGPEWSRSPEYRPPSKIDAHMYRAQVLDDSENVLGWVHLRQSIHNPELVVNIQSNKTGGCHTIVNILLNRFFLHNGHADELDLSNIQKFLGSHG
ncbi:hypothetical protein O6H91_05G078400 [Diphasiastrum complanatum]|uniref:Uncharacterized protein n=1 Tax=Diphasiastrum complanatum TaxID=34168 RepID=A0ACC2DQD7_DIPCM|nr:hypothetical protein O6H91_05G078400 [Diphasiastrum complanatum]